MNKKPKLIRITTIPLAMYKVLNGQLKYLSNHFEIIGACSREKYFDDLAKEEGIRVVEVEIKREISIFKDILSVIKLIKLFKLEKPLIIHSHTPKAGLTAMLAGWIAGVPIRIHTFTGLRFETTTGLLRKLLIFMDKVTCKCATEIIPEGDGVKNILITNQITTKPLNKIHNGNINGIDTTYFDPNNISESTKQSLKQELKIVENDFVFCFIGRMVTDKGINELISAFDLLNKKVNNVKLILVGPTKGESDRLQQSTIHTINTNNNIISVGLQQDIRPYLAIANLLVLPSYREGFPNVVLQAGAMGIPCIVSDISGCNEIIIDQLNGIIIPKKDEKSLLLAMEDSYSGKYDLQKMANNSRSIIVEKYNQEDIWMAILKKYQEIIKNYEHISF